MIFLVGGTGMYEVLSISGGQFAANFQSNGRQFGRPHPNGGRRLCSLILQSRTILRSSESHTESDKVDFPAQKSLNGHRLCMSSYEACRSTP